MANMNATIVPLSYLLEIQLGETTLFDIYMC